MIRRFDESKPSNLSGSHNIWFAACLQDRYFGGGPVVGHAAIDEGVRILRSAAADGFQAESKQTLNDDEMDSLIVTYYAKETYL